MKDGGGKKNEEKGWGGVGKKKSGRGEGREGECFFFFYVWIVFHSIQCIMSA